MFYNEWVSIKQGGRKAPAGGNEIFSNYDLNDYSSMMKIIESEKVLKDINKYNFDLKNLDYVDGLTTESGLDYLVFKCGGDWEYPLYFFVYYDGKTFRGYVPTRGNCVNTLNKCAFGNGENYKYNGKNADVEYIKKFKVPVSEHANIQKPSNDYVNLDDYDIEEKLDMCIEEFEARVEVESENKTKTSTHKVKHLDEMPEKQKSQKSNSEIETFVDEIQKSGQYHAKLIHCCYDIKYDDNEKVYMLYIGNNNKKLSLDSNLCDNVKEIIESTLPQYELMRYSEGIYCIKQYDSFILSDFGCDIFKQNMMKMFPWKMCKIDL